MLSMINESKVTYYVNCFTTYVIVFWSERMLLSSVCIVPQNLPRTKIANEAKPHTQWWRGETLLRN